MVGWMIVKMAAKAYKFDHNIDSVWTIIETTSHVIYPFAEPWDSRFMYITHMMLLVAYYYTVWHNVNPQLNTSLHHGLKL